jgi:hypothetical protein
MIHLVLPFNKKIVELKPVTLKDTLDFYHLGNDLKTIVKKLESFIITKNLNLIEKLYSLFYLRETCLGSLINFSDYALDINMFLSELEEVINIEKLITKNNFIIELDYPTNFCYYDNDETSLIKSIQIDSEKVILNDLDKNSKDVLLNYMPQNILKEVKSYKTKNDHNLQISFFVKGDNHIIKYLSTELIIFLKNIFTVLTPHSYRQHVFTLSKRMHDISYITTQSTLVDIEDYIDLYVKETEESKGASDPSIDGF